MPKFIQRFHGVTVYQINKMDRVKNRTIWYNYWDRCVRDEKDFWTKFNYIHYNPVKHGYVDRMDKWGYSSFPRFVTRFGEEWIDDVLRTYPVIDYDFEGEKADKARG